MSEGVGEQAEVRRGLFALPEQQGGVQEWAGARGNGIDGGGAGLVV
ncbi:hypothetical protein [Streptomyces anulatus]